MPDWKDFESYEKARGYKDISGKKIPKLFIMDNP
jgi:hypothetical protein